MVRCYYDNLTWQIAGFISTIVYIIFARALSFIAGNLGVIILYVYNTVSGNYSTAEVQFSVFVQLILTSHVLI